MIETDLVKRQKMIQRLQNLEMTVPKLMTALESKIRSELEYMKQNTDALVRIASSDGGGVSIMSAVMHVMLSKEHLMAFVEGGSIKLTDSTVLPINPQVSKQVN